MSVTSFSGCMNDDVLLVPADAAVPSVALNHRDEDGTQWLLTDIQGWWTLPPPSVLDIPRPQKQDGSYDVEGNYLPRLVTVSGQIRPNTPSLIPVKRSQLLRAIDTMRGGPMQIVAHENPSKMAWARLSDVPNINTSKQDGQTDFQIAFKCYDPRKYSVEERVGAVTIFTSVTSGRTYSLVHPRNYGTLSDAPGQLNALNIGTVVSPPTIELHGPLTSPEILNFTTSQTLSFPGLVIVDGETVTIDVQEHSAVSGLSAQRVSYLAHDSVWWWLQPGNNVVRLLAGAGTGYMIFKWRSAWME